MNPQQIREHFSAFQNSRILLTAFELEIFTVTDKAALSSSRIAEIIRTDIRATDRLLNALCVLGYLKKQAGKFSNPDFVSKFLVKGKPEFISGIYHSNHMWDTWAEMTEVIKKGKPAFEPNINLKDKEWLNAFIEAMHNRAKNQADPSVATIDVDNVNKVLDIGGGSGAFSMAFIRKKDTIKATIFDLPNVTPITQTYIEKEGFSGKIDTYDGDYNTDDIPTGYDLIYMSAIIHANSFEQNNNLIRKCVQSLNPGGQLVIQDFIMSDDRLQPERGAIFALNMLTGTKGGDTYTENEIRNWMTEAGLTNIIRDNLSFGSDQIIGKKP